ncbi:MAG TPA: HEAT repeat domain-containing protein [Bryobacteraceae bacterium]|jgi:hypothetical protein|nr:HEAT repeat domain-containing protein [Bryobacteraceae bacterium]
MTKQFFISVCLGASLLPLYTVVGRGADVAYMAAGCPVVAVGTLTSRNETASSVSFDLSIQRVLKGSAPGTVNVSHNWTRGGILIGVPPTITVTATTVGIWCLQPPAASADWDVQPINGPDGMFVSMFWPAVAALPAAYQAQAQNAPLADTLLFELAAGVEADGFNPAIAIGAAQGAQSSTLQFVANRFAASSNPDFQIAGLAGLIPVQLSAIGSVSGLWPSISSNRHRHQLVAAIRESFRDPSPASIQQLVQLASLSPEMREAAIHAISSIHSQASLPFLASLLTSSDLIEQARGVFGLSSFANVCPAETPANVVSMEYLQCANNGPYSTADTASNFASPETPGSQVVQFWINWWNQNQAALQ